MVWFRATKFWIATHVGRGRVYRGHPRPHCKGLQGPPQFFASSYLRAHNMRHNNQILHGNQTRCGEHFLHSRPRMLTRDPFAVANLVFSSSLFGNLLVCYSTYMVNKDEYNIKVYGVAQPTFSKFCQDIDIDKHSRLSAADIFQCVPKENERHISVLSDFSRSQNSKHTCSVGGCPSS